MVGIITWHLEIVLQLGFVRIVNVCTKVTVSISFVALGLQWKERLSLSLKIFIHCRQCWMMVFSVYSFPSRKYVEAEPAQIKTAGQLFCRIQWFL